MKRALLLLALPGCLALACAGASPSKPRTEAELPAGAQAWSLFGRPLYPPALPPDVKQQREMLFAQTEVAWQIRPESPEASLAMGRRQLDLGRVREAVAIFDDGVKKFPTSSYFLRFRAQGYLAERRFGPAAEDVQKALRQLEGSRDSFEQDTVPNRRGVPTTTFKWNCLAILGHARYAQADFAGAADAWRQAVAVSPPHDAQVAARLWLYLSLLAGGKAAEAPAALELVPKDWEMMGDPAAYRLALFFQGGGDEAALLAEARKGTLDVDLAETALGLWHLARGERPAGVDLLQKVEARDRWPEPPHIVAEATLQRLGERPAKR